MTEETKPTYAQPPLARGGLFAEPNFRPRLADRLGSVKTDFGVSEHWPKDIAPVFYPHVNNPLALGAMIITPPVQKDQEEGEKTLGEVPGGEDDLLHTVVLDGPPGSSEPEPFTLGSSVRGKKVLGPAEGLQRPESAVAPSARYGLAHLDEGEVKTPLADQTEAPSVGTTPTTTSAKATAPPQEVVEVLEASGAMEVASQPVKVATTPTEAQEEPAEYEPPLVLGDEEPL